MNDELLDDDWRYWYTCSLIRVIDGNSVELSVDLGSNVRIEMTARLIGINAPEMRGDERDAGQAAKEHLERLLLDCFWLTCRTEKDKTGKYGRWLVELFDAWPESAIRSVNHQMVADGHAVEKKYS